MSQSNKRETLSVVMPVYNEQEIIETVVREWYEMLDAEEIDFVIRCYNDGSKDDTERILNNLAQSLKRIVVVNKPNSGHGPTILQGYLDSGDSDWVFQVDSDNEISPDQFAQLWHQREGFHFMIGRRSHADFPVSRQIISFFARQVIRFGFSSRIVDVNSPYRLFRTTKVLPLIHSIPLDTFAPNILITGLASAHKLRTTEIQIENCQRETGTVSIKHWKLLRVAIQSFSESILYAIKFRLGMIRIAQ